MSQVRDALIALLRAYDRYIDTDDLDPLARAVGNAREVLARRHTVCLNCERCTWNPGPDCGKPEHPHCASCGHCQARHDSRSASHRGVQPGSRWRNHRSGTISTVARCGWFPAHAGNPPVPMVVLRSPAGSLNSIWIGAFFERYAPAPEEAP